MPGTAAAWRVRTPIHSPAGHARSYAETERRLEPLLDRVPITRVYGATALDRLGLPVWGAVTPLAQDLTVHAGKGRSPQAARISAVMEAIERVSAEEVDPARIHRASFSALQREDPDGVLDPARCDLAFETAYAPERDFSWVRGEELMSGRRVWVALDLAVSPAREGISTGPNSNGLAAGNTHLEAALHAVYEIVERDAEAQRYFLRRFAEPEQAAPMRLLSADSLPAPAADWVARLQAAELFVSMEEITHDVGIPAFRTLLADRAFPGQEGASVGFDGLGCDLDAENALMRSIGEAAQSHTGVLLGARERIDGGDEPTPSVARFLHRLLTPSLRVPFTPTTPPPDLDARLAQVLDRLRAVGLHQCVVVDLTREDLALPVVRAVIPGACGLFGQTPRRPGLRLLRHLV